MIGKRNSQISILDSAFNSRTKRSRSDALLEKIADAVDWKKLADDVQALNQEVLNNYKKLGAVGQNPMPAKVFVSVASKGKGGSSSDSPKMPPCGGSCGGGACPYTGD